MKEYCRFAIDSNPVKTTGRTKPAARHRFDSFAILPVGCALKSQYAPQDPFPHKQCGHRSMIQDRCSCDACSMTWYRHTRYHTKAKDIKAGLLSGLYFP